MKVFFWMVRSAVIPFFAGLFFTSFSSTMVMAKANCHSPIITDSEQLVRLALSCNGNQQAIGSRWQAQKFRSQAAGQLDDPKLMLAVAPQTLGNDRVDDGYIIELSQPLPWPGVLSLREKAAEAQSDVWLARQNQDQLRLANTVRQTYAQWQYHHELLSISKRHQQLWQQFIDVVQAKYASGTANKSAVLQATHEHHLLLQEAIELTAAIERDSSQLKQLANLHNGTEFAFTTELPITFLAPNVFDDVFEQLDGQPALLGLKAQRRQKDSELALAEKDRYPSFSAMARYNSLWINDEQRWVAGVSFNLPFDFGKRSSKENSLRAEQSALGMEQQDVRVQLREQLVQAYSFWQQALKVYQLYQKEFLPLAEESLTTALDEYQSGTGDFLLLLTAQRQLLSTERELNKALRDQYVQFSQLTAAAGLVELSSWKAVNASQNDDGIQRKDNDDE